MYPFLSSTMERQRASRRDVGNASLFQANPYVVVVVLTSTCAKMGLSYHSTRSKAILRHENHLNGTNLRTPDFRCRSKANAETIRNDLELSTVAGVMNSSSWSIPACPFHPYDVWRNPSSSPTCSRQVSRDHQPHPGGERVKRLLSCSPSIHVDVEPR